MRPLIVCAMFLAVASAHAEDKIQPPKNGSGVETALAKVESKDGQLKVTIRVVDMNIAPLGNTHKAKYTVHTPKEVNGKIVYEITYAELEAPIFVPVFREIEIGGSDVKVMDLDGQSREVATLTDRMSKFTPILLNVDIGEPIDPFWTLNIKEKTLIFRVEPKIRNPEILSPTNPQVIKTPVFGPNPPPPAVKERESKQEVEKP